MSVIWHHSPCQNLKFSILYSPLIIRCLACAVCVGVLFGAPAQGIAIEQSVEQNRAIIFNISSQPLASALERYGDLTGREVLYDSALVAGRRATAVDGILSPQDALSRLLEGTGLLASFLPDGSFVLAPAPQSSGRAQGDVVPLVVQRRYYTRIQISLRDAFCESNIARAGDYRVVVKFWIGPTGDLARFERLGSAGSANLDQRIDETFRGLQIGAPPPKGFLQPVLIMIVPQGQGVTMGCNSDRAGLRQAGSDQ